MREARLLALVAPLLVVASMFATPASARPACTISGTNHADNLRGTAGSNVICAKDGPDRANGRGRGDIILGQGGRDTLLGGSGPDTVRGGPKGDTLIGGAGRDHLFGGSGADVIDATRAGNDVVHGGSGRDVCYVDTTDTVRGCDVTVVGTTS
jgi:Ca2+-binding RTX toxin-like protein